MQAPSLRYMIGQMLLAGFPGTDMPDAQAVRLLFLFAQFPLLDFDIVFPGQPFQGFVIVQLLVLHDEMDHVSSLAAAEAFAQSFAGRYAEGGCLFIVERTQADIVDTATAQRHKFRHDIHNLCRVHNPVDGSLVYHTYSI